MEQSYSNIGRGLRISARRFPHKPALVEIPRLILTYSQLDAGVNRLAHRLASLGVRKGDHVGVLSENSVEHIISLYAIARLGAVSVALDPKWTTGETGRAAIFFDCKLLILDRALEAKVGALGANAPQLGILRYDKDEPGCELLNSCFGFPESDPQALIDDDEICTLVLTSGTTGIPKGVMRSHRNVEAGCINGVMGKAQDENGRELAVVPLYYGSGRGSVISQIFLGATVYVLPQFDAERVAWTIAHEGITAVALAPTMCRRILALPNVESYDFSSLAALRKAGSPFSLEMVRELRARITPFVYQAYSSTETGTVTLLRPAEQIAKAGSSGRPVWGVELALMDESGREIAGEGEICVRGPNVCQGYYKNPEEQARAIRGGWFRTGDIGRFDADGYLYVVGRIKDMIKTGGISVSPREIEIVLQALPQVEDAAVVGVPDPEWGEAVKAFVVARDATIGAEAILAECRTKLAGYKVPKSVTFVERIERNALGKVTQEFKAQAS